MKKLVSAIAILVGILFIFSGFVKAVDPLGFSYKLVEYFMVFKMDFLIPTALTQSVLICAFEIFLGLAFIFHYKMRTMALLSIAMMVFFTILTGVSAIFDVVKECGCFGNAIPLTAWQSFYKDLILMVLIGLIFWKRNELTPWIDNDRINRYTVYGGGIASLALSIWCLNHLPVVDFRSFKIGNDIEALTNDGKPPVIEYAYKMKHKETGEEKIFPASEYANVKDTYDLVDGISNILEEEIPPSIEDFIISDVDGNEVTQDILNYEGLTVIVLSKDLTKITQEQYADIMDLTNAAMDANAAVVGLCPNSYEEIDQFRHQYQAAYPYHVLDEKVVKTIARANPAVMLLKDGVITGKWHYKDTPKWTDIQK